MTEDEKRAQKAELLLSYQEAENNLAHLRQKAHQIASSFAAVSTWLKCLASFDKKPTYGEDLSALQDVVLKDIEASRTRLNFDEAVALAGQIKAAEDLLVELRRRKEQLGLR